MRHKRNHFGFSKVLVNMGLLLVSCSIGILICEAAVRAFGLYSIPKTENFSLHTISPFYGYQGKPQIETTITAPEYKIRALHNSKGLRDDEKKYEKEAGMSRIVILGDSFMWGVGVEQNEIFAKQLELYFRKVGKRVETVNAGVAGYGPTTELLWLENEGIKYQPDLVLLAFYIGNDVEAINEKCTATPCYRFNKQGELELENFPVPMHILHEYYLAPKDVKKPAKFSLKDFFAHHSAFYVMAREYIKRGLPQLARLLVAVGVISKEQDIPTIFQMYSSGTVSSWNKNFEWTGTLIERMKEVSHKVGSEFVVVIVPEKFRVNFNDWKLTKEVFDLTVDCDPELPTQSMVHFFRGKNLNYYDLAPEFQNLARIEKKRLYYRFDNHWNALGHKFAAQLVAKYLLNRGSIE